MDLKINKSDALGLFNVLSSLYYAEKCVRKAMKAEGAKKERIVAEVMVHSICAGSVFGVDEFDRLRREFAKAANYSVPAESVV